jgi:hypothetical protein
MRTSVLKMKKRKIKNSKKNRKKYFSQRRTKKQAKSSNSTGPNKDPPRYIYSPIINKVKLMREEGPIYLNMLDVLIEKER